MEENVELLDHPPYSPDLSLNDFFTLPKIKNGLRGQSINQVLAKIWCKTIPYFLELLSQFGDCTSRMLSRSS
ncbi:unnamed protein product [Acanthoscelides obtectus]|uniref:Histone-lysine N-methyltransferase SETMAR n=1 Tax=Acanthoscelides obtectus TaxID=200917 RepID=A0A9P0K3Z5_ACAOB|nr:unnamed protein product [Acanthoscelides obtectus]CAK1665911.1 hypothetical protein AOBTE_LOCUS25042 [Acanthoscelides obtectus]